jgi:glycosyltransferase involved in cell wall biosynthesis
MPTRLALIADYLEEGWPSMELVTEMLDAKLRQHHAHEFSVSRWRPTYRRRFSRVPALGGFGRNTDRLFNRMVDYPRWLSREVRRDPSDLYHICDHSHAHLVHALPAERTGVFCHDLDTFRSILAPELEPRPAWFRRMARRILDGLRKAAVVFHSTAAVRAQILQYGLVEPDRLVAAPYGHAEEFTPNDVGAPIAPAVRQALAGPRFLLHVGSCIPRKRVDVALDVLARLRGELHEDLRLVKVGGELTASQREQIERLRLQQAVVHLIDVDRPSLAALYRGAAAVLQPSDAEGFGLPVIEALACGAPLIASDIAPLREVGGDAVLYCSVGDVEQWAATTARVLRNDPPGPPPVERRLAQAARFSWDRHADTIAAAYRRLSMAPLSSPT